MSRPTSWNEWETYRRKVEEEQAALKRRISELESSLKSERNAADLRQNLIEQVKGERDRMIARTQELSKIVDMVHSDSGFRNLHESLQGEIIIAIGGEV